jgi:hypothetical protein
MNSEDKIGEPMREEVFHARLLVTWPPIYDREMGTQWETFLEHEADLRGDLQQTVSRTLGEGFLVEGIFYRRGSIELLVLVGAVYTTVKEYKGLRDSVAALVNDLAKVTRRFFQTTMPQALEGANAYDVQATWTPGPAMIRAELVAGAERPARESAKAMQAATPQAASGPLTWYLIISNGVLILSLIFLLVWVVALS